MVVYVLWMNTRIPNRNDSHVLCCLRLRPFTGLLLARPQCETSRMRAGGRDGLWGADPDTDSGPWCQGLWAVQERQGAAGLVMTFVQTRSAHWTSGHTPSPSLAAIRAPVMERPRSGCALCTHNTRLNINNLAFLRSQSISLYTLLITSQQGPFLYYYWVSSHGPPLRSPGLDWMDRLSCHQLIVVTRSLRPAQQSPAVVAPCPRPQDSPRHRTTIQLLQWINFPKHWRFWGFRNTDMNTECCSRRFGIIALTILVVLILVGEISKEIKPLFSPIVQHQHQHSRDQAARASLPSVPWFLDSSWKVTQTWSNPPWTCERRINIPEASTI